MTRTTDTNARSNAVSVVLDNVSKTFANGAGAVAALQDVNISISESSIVAILGPSGCGKSTLLRMIAGLDVPTSGRITLNGDSPVTFRSSGQLGIAFQEPALLPWRSVTSNVSLPLEILQRTNRDSRVRDLVAEVRLSSFSAAKPRTLSGGMKERVSLARALVTEPRLLLLDEPFRSLDDVTRIQMNALVENFFLKHRPTIVLVTHSIFDALALADRIVLFSAGPKSTVASTWNVSASRPRTRAVFSDAHLRDLHQQITSTIMEGGGQSDVTNG